MTVKATQASWRERDTPNFNRVARIYRWMEYLVLGSLLCRTREHHLTDLKNAQHALVLGDGDGRFTAALLRSAPAVRVVAVDTSATMLSLLSRRCARQGHGLRVQVLERSALDHHAMAETDLIATHFFLDCLYQEEVDRLAKTLAAEVGEDCRWVISEFCVPRDGLARMAGRAYIRTLYVAFRLLTGLRPQHLPDHRSALRAAGWVRSSQHRRAGGLLISELWRLNRCPGMLEGPGTTCGRVAPST